MDLKKYIRSIPDYPKKDILFRDITTLIKNQNAFKECIDQMTKILNTLDKYVDYFVIVESKFTHKGEKRNLKFNHEKFKKFEIFFTY